MTDQKQNTAQPQTTPTPIQPAGVQPMATPAVSAPEAPKSKSSQIVVLLKEVFTKIRSNKKMFRIIMIFVGVIAVIITVGTIFSIVKRMRGNTAPISTPTPVPTAEIKLTEVSKNNESRLKELKDIILKLDINQKYLTPPILKFDISF